MAEPSEIELLHNLYLCGHSSLSYFHRLRYNSITNQYGNTEGVETNVPGFGNTSSVEYLDPAMPWFEPTQYFHAMVQHFVQLGYEPGKNIRGAPFDWRYSAGGRYLSHLYP